MNALFYSEQPCYFKIDGNFVGEINKNPTILNCFFTNSLLEFIPKNSEYFSITTLLKDKLNVKIFQLKDDLIIVPLFEKKHNLKYRILLQEKFLAYNSQVILTIVQEGGYKFYLDGAITYTDNLPFKIENFQHSTNSNILYLCFIGIKTVIFAFDLNSNVLLFKNVGDNVKIEKFIFIENNYKIALPVNVIEKWDASSFNLIEKTANPIKSKFEISQKLFSTAFFEFIALGVPLTDFLSSNLLSREKELYSFIEKPIAVFPYYKNLLKTVVLDNNNAHLYSLDFEDNLICNIIEE